MVKVKEYLTYKNDPETEYIELEDLYDRDFGTGVFHPTTINEIVVFNDIVTNGLPYFLKELYKALSSDIEIFYEEVERHLDGRYGVYYEL
jgi:hypothetical protein